MGPPPTLTFKRSCRRGPSQPHHNRPEYRIRFGAGSPREAAEHPTLPTGPPLSITDLLRAGPQRPVADINRHLTQPINDPANRERKPSCVQGLIDVHSPALVCSLAATTTMCITLYPPRPPESGPGADYFRVASSVREMITSGGEFTDHGHLEPRRLASLSPSQGEPGVAAPSFSPRGPGALRSRAALIHVRGRDSPTASFTSRVIGAGARSPTRAFVPSRR
jgi:hypothetical protein